MAFVMSKAGSDWHEVRIKEVVEPEIIPRHLTWIKFSGIAWRDSGLYYSHYDAPASDALTRRNEYQKFIIIN